MFLMICLLVRPDGQGAAGRSSRAALPCWSSMRQLPAERVAGRAGHPAADHGGAVRGGDDP